MGGTIKIFFLRCGPPLKPTSAKLVGSQLVWVASISCAELGPALSQLVWFFFWKNVACTNIPVTFIL